MTTATAKKLNEKFIAATTDLYGYWGAGATIEEAKKQLCKAGGKIKGCRLWRFTSELPFCPAGKKDADETEADCWIDRYGGLNWIRCDRKMIEG